MPQTSRLIIGILRRIGVISLLVLAGVTAVDAQRRNGGPATRPLETGTSTLAGKVVDAQSREPIAGAEITVSSFTGSISRGAVTTSAADGSYGFAEIGEGAYMLMARAPGHLAMCVAGNPESAAPCSAVNLLRDQKRDDIQIAMVKGAVARGRIVDRNGTPVANATVRIGSPLQPGNEIARTFLFPNAVQQSAADGSFELRGIPPGEWNIEVQLPPQPRSMPLPLMFYPGVLRQEDATRLEFVAGGVSGNLTFVIPAVAENTITVRVSPGPLPVSAIRASLIQSVPFVARAIALNAEGIGDIRGLMDGRYFIAARAWIENKAWAAYAIVDFLSPSADVPLQMLPAGTIKGRIVAKNGGLPPLDGVAAAALWVHDDVEISPVTPDQVPVSADGSFRIDGLFGTRLLQLVGLDTNWRVASVLLGRTEMTSVEVPLDTTFDVTIVVARK